MTDTEKLTFSLADLTWGQMEFLTDYTGRTNEEMLEAFASRDIKGRDVIAIMAIAHNPADPQAAVDDVRNMQVADVRLNFADTDLPEVVEVTDEEDTTNQS